MTAYIKEFPDIRTAKIIEMQGLRYEKGGHYKFHVDDGPGMDRKFSSILILNNDYEGGELCFKIDGKEEIVKNTPGSLIIWPSSFMFPHMVKPLKKRSKVFNSIMDELSKGYKVIKNFLSKEEIEPFNSLH